MNSVECKNCGQPNQYKLNIEEIGEKIKCRTCGEPFIMPSSIELRRLIDMCRLGDGSLFDRRKLAAQEIESWLPRIIKKVKDDILPKLVDLKDLYKPEERGETRVNQWDEYTTPYTIPGDFYSTSSIRQLGEQELQRRGLVVFRGKALPAKKVEAIKVDELAQSTLSEANRKSKSRNQMIRLAILVITMTILYLLLKQHLRMPLAD